MSKVARCARSRLLRAFVPKRSRTQQPRTLAWPLAWTGNVPLYLSRRNREYAGDDPLAAAHTEMVRRRSPRDRLPATFAGVATRRVSHVPAERGAEGARRAVADAFRDAG